MKKIKRLLISILILIFIASCTKKENEISFGYQPFGSNLAFFVAVEKGFFKEKNISIDPIRIISANDAANAVINNQIVGNATLPLNVLLNIEELQPGLFKIFLLKATSSSTWSDYLLVKKGSDIKQISDLKGKKVGGYPGSAQQTLLKLVLGKFMDENDILTVELPPNTQLPALEAGQIDALITYDELAIIGLTNDIADILVENPLCKYVIDPFYGFPYVLSSQFVDREPDLAFKIRDAMYEAVDFIKSNESEAREIMAKWVGTNPDIAIRVNLWDQVKEEDIDRKALQKLADIFFEEGVTNKRIDTSNLYLSK